MANNVLRLSAVKDRTGLSRSSIYNKLNPKSRYHDSSFPTPIRLGARAVGWDEQSIQGWIDRQIERSRNGEERAA
ncbi:MAG: AlpA family phage regulatory protein [Gammaproteobacteria bacterium]|nr:AlpA family phage regulatory protein [Gammaproteobacteria bacterium]